MKHAKEDKECEASDKSNGNEAKEQKLIDAKSKEKLKAIDFHAKAKKRSCEHCREDEEDFYKELIDFFNVGKEVFAKENASLKEARN